MLASAHEYQRSVVISGEKIATIRDGEVVFKLSLIPGNEASHADYSPEATDEQTYEAVATSILRKLFRHTPDPVFIDIGGFNGYFACLAAGLLGDRPVWSVESNPIFSDAIRRSVALNGFTSVRVIDAALSDREGSVMISGPGVYHGHDDGNVGPTTQAITLDAVCAREGIRPSIVKIDVHGAEGKVLGGMTRVLRESIQFILLELHPAPVFQKFSPGATRAELLAWLESQGFTLFHVAGHRHPRDIGVARHLAEGRLVYVPLTATSCPAHLFDRAEDILIVASKSPDIGAAIGPAAEI